jgi:hypothetical protein
LHAPGLIRVKTYGSFPKHENCREAKAKMTGQHLSPLTIWSYVFDGHQMSGTELAHLMDCNHCLKAMKLCIKSDSFASVLASLKEELEAQGKPSIDVG